MDSTLRSRASLEWFGYGRWDAPYWFIGMEPGGIDSPENYEAWQACGGGSLIDAKRHEDEWNARVEPKRQTRYFADKPKIQQWTWQPLIHILLGFTGRSYDPHIYQRDKLGRADGETALIELSAAAYPSLKTVGDRENRSERVKIISQHLKDATPPPVLAVFYGLGYEDYYEEIAGRPFGSSGTFTNATTLCALTAHPARPTKSYDYWTEYGRQLRAGA